MGTNGSGSQRCAEREGQVVVDPAVCHVRSTSSDLVETRRMSETVEIRGSHGRRDVLYVVAVFEGGSCSGGSMDGGKSVTTRQIDRWRSLNITSSRFINYYYQITISQARTPPHFVLFVWGREAKHFLGRTAA